MILRETRQCFLVEVPDRSAATLLQAILDNIEEGSIIISDCWRGYNTEELEEAGFEHFKVNHKYNLQGKVFRCYSQIFLLLAYNSSLKKYKAIGTRIGGP